MRFRVGHNGLLRDIGETPARLTQSGTIVAQAAENLVHAREDAGPVRGEVARTEPAPITLSVHDDLAAVERDWRRLEEVADCTPFQTFDWLFAWQRRIGAQTGVTPAIVVVRRGDKMLLLLPLGVAQRGFARCLTFLGDVLCDYNAPLLAPEFAALAPEEFLALWGDIRRLLQATPGTRHDLIVFDKMPAKIGGQKNPMLALNVQRNPSGAYETPLPADWEPFYASKRSSSTRRRDRTKLKRLGELGPVKFVNPDTSAELALTFDLLVQQKSKAFARMGVPNLFAPPGHAAFYRELATSPRYRSLVHLSRLDVGTTWAALNLGLTFRDCYFHILASYDDGETSRFGPGAAHLRELLRYAIGRGCKRFDFTIGDEPYKRDWCDTEQQLFDYSAATSLRGLPAAAMTIGWGRAKRAIKQTAPLWNAVQRLRAAAGSLRKKAKPEE
jgi:CelD/BcsL family acetyltransferase involved in cellulose biosynthesis